MIEGIINEYLTGIRRIVEEEYPWNPDFNYDDDGIKYNTLLDIEFNLIYLSLLSLKGYIVRQLVVYDGVMK
jgi:hypothetical protein